MSSPLTRDDVLRIASLAHLELTDAEVDLFGGQLAAILTFAEDIQQADTSGVAPTAHPIPIAAFTRDDEPVPSVDRRTVLEQAPDAALEAGLFKVPKVL